MTESSRGDEILQRLVALARTQRAEISWRERKVLERLDEVLGERRIARARSRRRTVIGATLVAACSLLAAMVL